jgi:hypothetical protein
MGRHGGSCDSQPQVGFGGFQSLGLETWSQHLCISLGSKLGFLVQDPRQVIKLLGNKVFLGFILGAFLSRLWIGAWEGLRWLNPDRNWSKSCFDF